jgi:hypothetical protein
MLLISWFYLFIIINIVYAMFINIEVPRLVKLRCHPERNVTYYNAELKSYFLPFFIYNNNKKIKNIKTWKLNFTHSIEGF